MNHPCSFFSKLPRASIHPCHAPLHIPVPSAAAAHADGTGQWRRRRHAFADHTPVAATVAVQQLPPADPLLVPESTRVATECLLCACLPHDHSRQGSTVHRSNTGDIGSVRRNLRGTVYLFLFNNRLSSNISIFSPRMALN